MVSSEAALLVSFTSVPLSSAQDQIVDQVILDITIGDGPPSKLCLFIYIGAWMPFETFNMPDFGVIPRKLTVLLLSILVVRRIPCLPLLYRFVPEITSWKEALFSGHFGAFIPGPPFLLMLIHGAGTCKFSL
jgi:hypothetical protein